MRTLTKKVIFSVLVAFLAVSCLFLVNTAFSGKNVAKADSPTVTCSGINIYNNNLLNSGYYITLLEYDIYLGDAANATNVVSTTGQGITLNGVKLSAISGAVVDYAHGKNRVEIKIPQSYQEALAGDIVLEVIEGTHFENQVLDGAKFTLLSAKWTKMTSATFSDIRHNNVNYQTHCIDIGTSPANGIYVTLRFYESFGETTDTTNLATEDYEIGTGLKINGVSIKDISGSFVDASAGSVNMHVYVPFTGLSEYKRAILTVDDGTAFRNKYINAFTVYFNGSSWTTTANTKTAVSFSNIQWNNTNYDATNFGGNGVLLNYSANLSTVGSELNGGIPGVELKSYYGKYITLNGQTLDNIANAELRYHSLGKLWIYAPGMTAWNGRIPTIEIAANAPFLDAYLPALTLYWNGSAWQTSNPRRAVGFSRIRWNNLNYGVSELGGGAAGLLLEYDANLSLIANEINGNIKSTELKSVYGSYITLNGQTLNNIAGAELRYHSQGNLWIYAPNMTSWDGRIPTIEIAANTPFSYSYIPALTLYWNGSAWQTSNPRRAVNFSTIAWNNLNYDTANLGGGANGVLLRYDANLSLVASEINGGIKTVELKSLYGSYITLNGQTLNNIAGAELRYHSQGNLWIYAPNMTSWDGRIPTIEIAANTPFSYSYIPALTLYWNGSAWQTSDPQRAVNFSTIAWNNINHAGATFGGAGVLLRYDANLSLVPNEINGNIKTVELKSLYGSYITVNGETLDNIAGAELRYHSQGNLWIYAPGMTTWEDNIPTIEIAEGAPFSYSILPALTLRFDGAQWEVYVAPTVTCSGINIYNNNLLSNGFYITLIDYNTNLGDAANSTDVVSTTGQGITLNGVKLSEISGAVVNYGHGTTHMQIKIPQSYQDAITGTILLEVVSGTRFENQVLDGARFALTGGSWRSVYDVTLSRVRWNDADSGNAYDGKKGILLQYDTNLSTVGGEINGNTRSNTNFASTVGEHIYLGGQKLSTLPGALVSYHSQDNLFIYADNMAAYRTFTIEEGTPILNAILPELNLYYNGDSKWTTTNRTVSPVTYSNIQWNNIGYEVYEGKAGVLLNFGTNLSLVTAEINGGLATANLKDIYGSNITLNGETLDNIANAELAYFNTMFVWIYAPGMTTWENHVPTIEIAANSPFMDATLSAVTIYFYDNEWKEVAPKVLTINYSAGEYSRIRLFENSVTVSSEYLTDILSDSYDHATVLSWTIGSTDYFYGDTSNVNATATVNITTVLDFYTLAGAYIRLSNDGVTGLRFESRINTVDYNALLDSCDDVEFGTYIAPKVLLDAYLVANYGTTFRDYFAQAQGSGNSSKYVKVVNQGIYNRETYEEDGYVQFFGSLGNIYEINYYTKFVGVGYAKITIGGNTYVVFGATSLVNNTRTVYDIAKIAYNDTSSDFTDSQLASIKVYIDAVAELTYKLGTLSVNEVVTEREYSSPYQASHTDGYYYLARFGSVELPKTILINGKKISSSHFGSTVNAGSVAMHISDANMAELFTDGVVYGVGEPDSNLWDNHNTVATASMLSDVTGALGATAFRVWLQDTANISSSNDVSLIPAKMTELKNLIDGLARNGVEEIYLIGVHFPSATYANYYVDGVGWETGYSYYTTHNGTDFYRDYSCVPDPSTEAAAYAEWLKVQADYYSLLTAQIAVWKENSPDWNNIRFYFEGINEPEGQLIIHKRGSYSFGTGEYTYNYFNTATLAKVLTDVSYYMTLAVNANLGGAGYVTTSALMYLTEGSGNVPESGVSSDGLLGAMAAAIKDNVAPTAISGVTPANTNDPEAYFTVLNWHPYLSWVEGSHNELYYATIGWVNDGTPSGKVTATVNSDYVADWVAWNNSLYNAFVSQFTGFAPKVVFSEFGMIDYGDYAASDQFFKAIGITEELAATVFRTLLVEGLDDLTFANNCTVIAFRLCDVESIFRAEQETQGYLDIYVYGEGNLGLIEEDGTVKAIMREYYYVIHGDRNTAALQTVISGYYD